jgi:uncharacterized RDD family membrane protein YckC
MNWYYSAQGQQLGPVDETAFNELVASGQIQPTTLVWNSELPSWKPLSEVQSASVAVATGPTSFCSECGGKFQTDEMIQFGTSRVCANCKDRFAQKVREGVSLGEARHYAGFWIRVLARIIDAIILNVGIYVLDLVVLGRTMIGMGIAGITPLIGVMFVVRFAIGAAYEIWFLGKFGATPGKMVLGLRVITAAGGPLTYGLSTGRYFAQMVSAFTIGIGYIMAGFDSEKRALHDRICNTRVVRK